MTQSRHQIKQELRSIDDDIENLCKHLAYCTNERFDSIVIQIKELRAQAEELQKKLEEV